jgi:hypothetical protein
MPEARSQKPKAAETLREVVNGGRGAFRELREAWAKAQLLLQQNPSRTPFTPHRF